MAGMPGAKAVKEVLSQAELREALGGLSDVDHYRLRKKIAVRLAWARGMSPDDLLNTAFVRALDGTRKCPRELNLVIFLTNIMRSIRSAHRKTADYRLTDQDGDALDEAVTPEGALGADVEGDLITIDFKKKQVEELFVHFDSDEDATYFLIARMEAETLSEAATICGFDGKKANTVWRRITRKIEQVYPEGLQP